MGPAAYNRQAHTGIQKLNYDTYKIKIMAMWPITHNVHTLFIIVYTCNIYNNRSAA